MRFKIRDGNWNSTGDDQIIDVFFTSRHRQGDDFMLGGQVSWLPFIGFKAWLRTSIHYQGMNWKNKVCLTIFIISEWIELYTLRRWDPVEENSPLAISTTIVSSNMLSFCRHDWEKVTIVGLVIACWNKAFSLSGTFLTLASCYDPGQRGQR